MTHRESMKRILTETESAPLLRTYIQSWMKGTTTRGICIGGNHPCVYKTHTPGKGEGVILLLRMLWRKRLELPGMRRRINNSHLLLRRGWQLYRGSLRERWHQLGLPILTLISIFTLQVLCARQMMPRHPFKWWSFSFDHPDHLWYHVIRDLFS